MKLTIDIPEWALDRSIVIMAGPELVAYVKRDSGKILYKTERCTRCGWCCRENLPEPCQHLFFEGTEAQCRLGSDRPWRCVWPDPILTNNKEALAHCACRYEDVSF